MGRDSVCLCFPEWQGQCCDQPDCSCHNADDQDCSGNGVCRQALGDSNSSCICSEGWTGRCCDARIPVTRAGDPHLSTVDGRVISYYIIYMYNLFLYLQDENLIILELGSFGTAEAKRMTLVCR